MRYEKESNVCMKLQTSTIKGKENMSFRDKVFKQAVARAASKENSNRDFLFNTRTRTEFQPESLSGFERRPGVFFCIPGAPLVSAMLLAASGIFLSFSAEACTRFTYVGLDNNVITGRSWDWPNDGYATLWAYPAGLSRSACVNDKNSVAWVSKYGSVTTSAFNVGTADGINTEGLSVNILYLAGSDYGKPDPGKKNLTLFSWAQFMLDNYATVKEAVEDFGSGKYNMLGVPDMDGEKMHLHLCITDVGGDNAVFEYIDGKLVVHHGKQYNVMTNEPSFDQQLALNAYWQRMDGKFLPGTEDPADRFVRTSYYLDNALKTKDYQQMVATVFSIIRNASVPFLNVSQKRPNLAPTYWRSVGDLTNRIYYFEEANRPNVFWVDLKKLDLKNGAPVKKLPLVNGEIYSGEVSAHFVAEKPFILGDLSVKKTQK